MSPCIYYIIFFQFPVGESGQPWPKICLHQGCIAQSGEGRRTFLSRFSHSYLALNSMTILKLSGRLAPPPKSLHTRRLRLSDALHLGRCAPKRLQTLRFLLIGGQYMAHIRGPYTHGQCISGPYVLPLYMLYTNIFLA